MLLKIATVASALTMSVVPPGGEVVCVGAGAHMHYLHRALELVI